MAGAKRYGTFEYGDVYALDTSRPNNRGDYEGRLVVDQDAQTFYVKSPNKASRRIPHDRVNYMLANGLIEFDHEDSESYLIDYMMRLAEHREKVKEQRMAQYQAGKEKKAIDESKKLVRKTKRNARLSKIVWFMGCLVIAGLGVLAAIPEKVPEPQAPSIAGYGDDYQIQPNLLSNATYMTAIGNGPSLYGLVFDDIIIESGQQNANESTIKENVMVNADVSDAYPLHLRPLYYDRTTFYQSQLILNDANQGSTAVCLQNPQGYSLGLPANELVLMGGQGMSTVSLSSPDPFKSTSARDAARDIEDAQKNAANDRQNVSQREENLAASMPDAWNGYDYADIDANKVAASYWYTTDSTKRIEDLHRRIVVWDISSVINEGEKGIASMEPIQFNYQDRESNFYNPVISLSPSSNGSRYWIGYTKQAINGAVGFYIRLYENADDILVESYDNTLSTFDLTGTDYPISNYTLSGDKLFFEQQGYIWVMDLSKITIAVDLAANQRVVKKENPIQICRSSDIRPSITRDEEFRANILHATSVPVAHYQVTQITTSSGIQYGISFIESETGDLVFQPCLGATAAAASEVEGSGGDQSGATGVSSGNQAQIEKLIEEKEQRTNRSQLTQEEPEPVIEEPAPEIPVEEQWTETQDDQIIPFDQASVRNFDGNVSSIAHQMANVQSFEQAGTAETNEVTTEKGDSSSVGGRILIRPGSVGEYQIICFCVRGDMFYWIEQSDANQSRLIKMSPVYYKNDAQQARTAQQAEEQKEVDQGLEAYNGENEGQSVGGDSETASPDYVPDATDPAMRAEAAKREQQQQALLAQQQDQVENSDPTGGDTLSETPPDAVVEEPPLVSEAPIEEQIPVDPIEMLPEGGEVIE